MSYYYDEEDIVQTPFILKDNELMNGVPDDDVKEKTDKSKKDKVDKTKPVPLPDKTTDEQVNIIDQVNDYPITDDPDYDDTEPEPLDDFEQNPEVLDNMIYKKNWA